MILWLLAAMRIWWKLTILLEKYRRLTEDDEQIVLSGKWLNDLIAMFLMKHDRDLLPVSSLQDPACSR